METEGDKFKHQFNLVKNDDEEEDDSMDGEDAPQIVTADGKQSLAQAGTTAQDYLAGMSHSLEKDLHKEMLME